MKSEIIQQEILLMATTTFSNRNWDQLEIPKHSGSLSPQEMLEEACWNGLLDNLLPEIMEKTSTGKNLYLWQIRHGMSFLEIELCEYPVLIDKKLSIDPYCFLPTINGN